MLSTFLIVAKYTVCQTHTARDQRQPHSYAESPRSHAQDSAGTSPAIAYPGTSRPYKHPTKYHFTHFTAKKTWFISKISFQMLSVRTSCNLFNFHKLSYQNADQNTRGKATGNFLKELRHLATFTCVDDGYSTGACVLLWCSRHCIDMRISAVLWAGLFRSWFVCKNHRDIYLISMARTNLVWKEGVDVNPNYRQSFDNLYIACFYTTVLLRM